MADDEQPGKMQAWLRSLKIETVETLDELRDTYGNVEDLGQRHVLIIDTPGRRMIGNTTYAEQWYADNGMIGIYDTRSTTTGDITMHQGRPFRKVAQGKGYLK